MVKSLARIWSVAACTLVAFSFGPSAAFATSSDTSLRGVIQRADGTPLRQTAISVSARLRPTISFLPSTPYVPLTRTTTDRRGRFSVRVRPPEKSIGFSILVFDHARRRREVGPSGNTWTYLPTPTFDVSPGKFNVIVVR